ncbi:hypothetical protein Syun_013913 [Stephania yunnanensis]|uniref:CAF-1 p60 homolog n=1 Tax=Stephania yunnanensis TaxID=152371 RepID=A0AAP0JK14_9MAGN
MKGGTLQINWHQTKPVLTLDFHPQSGLLATGGSDYDIKLWLINPCDEQKNAPTVSYQNSLSYHGSAVNVLRFSPFGDQLASGADGGELIIWKLHSTDVGQTWKVLKTLSFHRKDVLDLQWSTDGAFLISGSVDNSCIIWDMNKGSVHQILDGHSHYVQGVAWDPLGQYVASLSSDRTCRIYLNKPQNKPKNPKVMNFVLHNVIMKIELSASDSKIAPTKSYLFHDETLPSFFVDWHGHQMDPLLSIPCISCGVGRVGLGWDGMGFCGIVWGSCKFSPTSDSINTTYIFSRKDLSRQVRPAIYLPAAGKPVIAVRFCPVIFSLRGSKPAGLFKLSYRLVFAVATLNSLCIYDTENEAPIAVLAGLHYEAITDVAWSPDAKYLALSSQDGYCTLVEFGIGELGTPIPLPGTETKQNKAEENNEETVRGTETKQSKAEEDKIKISAKSEKMAIAPAVEVIDKDDRRTNIGGNEAKQTSGTSNQAPAPEKPARRRITPMAID